MDTFTFLIVGLAVGSLAAISLTALVRGGVRNIQHGGVQIVTATKGWEKAREIEQIEDATANIVAALCECQTAIELVTAAADGRFNGDLDAAMSERFGAAIDAMKRQHVTLARHRSGEQAASEVALFYEKMANERENGL
jgi:hypothetical protein